MQDEIQQIKARLDAIEKAIAVPPPIGAQTVDPAHVQECEEYWLDTLAHFGAARPVLPHDKKAVWELIKMYGDYRAVAYAIYGMRYEQKTASFDPAYNVSLRRLFDEKLFEKFVNIGAKKRNELKKKSGVA